MRRRHCRVSHPLRQCAFALGAGLAVATATPATGGDGTIVLQCRFSSGLAATYRFSPEKARVRRADLLQPREGRVKAGAAEYRFIFHRRDSAYRIDVVIDRATGNVRRVFGTRENMERMPEPGDRASGLVHEAGQCDARHGELP